MKRIFYLKTAFAVLAMTAFMACTESYPTMIIEEPSVTIEDLNKDEISKRTPVLLFVNPQDLFTVTATRGLGQFPPEDLNDYTKGSVYVYAFRDGKNDQGSELTSETDLRKTAYATGEGHDDDHADCLIDGDDYNLGLRTFVLPGSSGDLKYNTKDLQNYKVYGNIFDRVCYYSDRYQETPYNFFAYYIDDLDKNRVRGGNAHREADKIYYNIEVDGTQDIMCGMAPKLTEDLLDKYYKTEAKRLTDNELNIALNGYSKFTADHDIHPYMEMKHQLTQLRFVAYPADSTAGDVIIQKIEVTSKYKGTMTVAARDPSSNKIGVNFDDAKKTLYVPFPEEGRDTLTDESDAKKEEYGYTVKYDESMKNVPWNKRPSRKIGKSIIIPSDSTFFIRIYYKQRRSDTVGGKKIWIDKQLFSEKDIKLATTDDDKTKMFEPGYTYNVNIAVYGQQQVKFFTAFEDWIPGEDINIGDDDDW